MKEHFKKHQRVYILVGGVLIGVGIAGITYAIMRNNTLSTKPIGIDVKSSLPPSVDVKSSSGGNIFVFGDNNGSIDQTIKTKHVPIGNPGYLTRNIETGLEFDTQGEAARHFGIPAKSMSKHLNDGKPLASGLNFERVGAE